MIHQVPKQLFTRGLCRFGIEEFQKLGVEVRCGSVAGCGGCIQNHPFDQRVNSVFGSVFLFSTLFLNPLVLQRLKSGCLFICFRYVGNVGYRHFQGFSRGSEWRGQSRQGRNSTHYWLIMCWLFAGKCCHQCMRVGICDGWLWMFLLLYMYFQLRSLEEFHI